MDPRKITITLTVYDDGIYTNVHLDHQNFACLTEQPTPEMALAFALPEIRDYVARLRQEASPSAAVVDPTIVSRAAHDTNPQVYISVSDEADTAAYEEMMLALSGRPARRAD